MSRENELVRLRLAWDIGHVYYKSFVFLQLRPIFIEP